jgi:hypothetical protein
MTLVRLHVLVLLAVPVLLAVLAGCGGVSSGGSPTPTTGTVIVETVIAGTTDYLPVAADVVVGGVRGQVDLSQHWVVLSGVPLGSQNQQPLTATAPGYQTVTQTVQLSAYVYTTVSVQMSPVDLSQTATVQGNVTDSASGAPVPSALVTFTPEAGSPISGFADSAGHYHLGGIPAGPVEIMAQALGYIEGTSSATLTPDASGTNPALNLVLVSGSTKITVTGHVVSLGLESPISGAQVTIAGQGPATTDAQGGFSLPGVTVGDQSAHLTATGYDDKTQTVTILPTMGPLTFYLAPTSPGPPSGPYTITGQVLESDLQTPLVGATVTALDQASGLIADSVLTDASGHYYLFVPPGSYRITVTSGTSSIHTDVLLGGGGRILSGVNFILHVTTP